MWFRRLRGPHHVPRLVINRDHCQASFILPKSMQMEVRVLHLDDEPDFLDIAKSFLEGSGGIEVDGEADAARALEKLSKEDYDVVISDYKMPVMDGIEFLKEVRKKDERIPWKCLPTRYCASCFTT